MGKITTKSQKPGVMIYFEILPQLEMLKPLQRLAVFDAIMAYGKDHTEPVLKREAALAWGFIKPILDRDDERYQNVVDARKRGGKIRGEQIKKEAAKRKVASSQTASAKLQVSSDSQSTISKPQSSNINLQSSIINPQSSNINLQPSEVKERGTVSGSASEIFGFVPPSLPQVKEFVFQEGLRFLPEDFVDYYNANGWMIGKQPIQDWKAVARRWGRKEKVHGDNPFAGFDLGPHC